MWWVIGVAVYLLLLALGLLFLHGASKREDAVLPDLGMIDARMREQDSAESPGQLWLPFTPQAKPALSYARAGLVAAIIHKISGIFPHMPGS